MTETREMYAYITDCSSCIKQPIIYFPSGTMDAKGQMMGIMKYMLSITAGHTDVIFKEVEINRRRIAVHAVSQQYTFKLNIQAAVVRYPCIRTIYKKGY